MKTEDIKLSEDGENAIIKLSKLVDDGGVKRNELIMREPTVRDQLDIQSDKSMNESEREILLFANLCSVLPASIEGLRMKDYTKLQRAYAAFL